MTTIDRCPSCDGTNLYRADTHGTSHVTRALLPGLGGFLRVATLDVVVCADCGLTRLFAREAERAKLTNSSRWERVSPNS